MASDVKFEIFASQLFESLWHKFGYLSHKVGVLSLYPEEFPENTQIYHECCDMAVYVKSVFYHIIFHKECFNFINEFEASPLYVSDYISRKCRRDLLGDLTVFDLLFTSCAFVMQLSMVCILCFRYNDILSYAHLCWAMYFEEYKEEFYKKGGWSQLKILSFSYDLPFAFLTTFPSMLLDENKRAYIHEVLKTLHNYKAFTKCVHSDFKTVSKAWVKFRLQNLYKSDASGVTDMTNPKEVERVLLQFSLFCDPIRSKKLTNRFSTESKYSHCRKQSFGNVSQSLLKLNILNDMTCDTDSKQGKIQLDLKENAQTDKDTTCNEINVSQNTSSLKLKMTSIVDFPHNKTQSTSEQKLNEEIKKGIDLELESPEVKCLLRMILVLGNSEGIIHVRSSLPRSNSHKRKKKSKK